MDEYLPGQRQLHRLEHDRPVDGVELEDVLADDVNVRRPKRGGVRPGVEPDRFGGRSIAQCGRDAGVVAEGVKPHVRHVIIVERQGNAPL